MVIFEMRLSKSQQLHFREGNISKVLAFVHEPAALRYNRTDENVTILQL